MKEFKSLKAKSEFNFDKPNPELLERFSAPACSIVRLVNNEFTSLCPITGQPDYATISITYAPKDWCLESKSLKLYLAGYRNYGAFAETLAATIAHDLSESVLCLVEVTVAFASRGGITIEATARRDGSVKSH